MSEMKLLMENWRNVINEAELKYDEKMYKDMSQFVIDSYAHYYLYEGDAATDLKIIAKLLGKKHVEGKDKLATMEKIDETVIDDIKFYFQQFIELYIASLEDEDFKEVFEEDKLPNGTYEIAWSRIPLVDKLIKLNGRVLKNGSEYLLEYDLFVDDEDLSSKGFQEEFTNGGSIQQLGSDEFFHKEFVDSEIIKIIIEQTGVNHKVNDLFHSIKITNKMNANPDNSRVDPYWSNKTDCIIYGNWFRGDPDFVKNFNDDVVHSGRIRLLLTPNAGCVSNLPGGEGLESQRFAGFWTPTENMVNPNYITLLLDQHLPDILKTLRHELQHETQWLIKHINQLSHPAGGPSATYTNYDDEGNWTKEHPLRGIEYKPRLSDEIRKFKDRYFFKIDSWALRDMTDTYIRRRTNYEMNNWVQNRHWFKKLREHKPSWYKKAKKEFATAIIKALGEKLKEWHK